MTRLKYAFVFCAFFFNNAFAQTGILNIPLKYLHPIDTVTRPYSNDSLIFDFEWWVFSDRDNNPIYSSPAMDSVIGYLNFFDSCAIVDKKNEKLKISKPINIVNGKFLAIDKSAIGWVNFRNLLLSDQCVLSSKLQLFSSILVLNYNKFSENELITKEVFLYRSPKLITKTLQILNLSKLFVFKEDANSALVGNLPYFKESNKNNLQGSSFLIGWISKEYIIPWNHNLAWECNWHPKAIEERKQSNDSTRMTTVSQTTNSVFDTNQSIRFNCICSNAISLYDVRNKGLDRRYPIISTQSANQIGTVCFMNKSNLGLRNPKSRIYQNYINTCYHSDDNKYPNYQTVMLINKEDLTKLLRQIIVFENSHEAILREEAKHTLSFFIYCILGNKYMPSKKVELGEMLYRLSLFKIKEEYWNWTIEKIHDPSLGISLDDIKLFKGDLVDTRIILESILNLSENYSSTFKYQGNLYFWLPLDIFPHQPKNDDVKWSYY